VGRAAVFFAVIAFAQEFSCGGGGSTALGPLAACERTADCAEGLTCASGACTPVVDGGAAAENEGLESGAPDGSAD
jgi:hypothetical protein